MRRLDRLKGGGQDGADPAGGPAQLGMREQVWAMKVIGVALVGGMLLGTALIAVRPQAQETESEEPTDVTEAEVQLYIDVYAAMQEDHTLTIDQVLAGRQISLEEFRSIERRVQQQQRLVDRVRQALLDKAKSRTAFLSPPGPGSATPVDAAVKPTPAR